MLKNRLLACFAALTALTLAACGSVHKPTGSPPALPPAAAAGFVPIPGPHDGDGDLDRLTAGPRDVDKDAIPHFGRPASGSERRAILSLISRYYVLAAKGDGRGTCALLAPVIAETVVEEQRTRRPAAPRDVTCARVMSKLLRQRHAEVLEDLRSRQASAVQVRGHSAYALMRSPVSGSVREVQVLLHMQGTAWKMFVAIDNGSQ
jgi:hypothetical protein